MKTTTTVFSALFVAFILSAFLSGQQLGDGKGGFKPSPHSPFATQSYPHVHGVGVADFNGDGKPDVATDNWAAIGDGAGNLNLSGKLFNIGKRPYECLALR